MEKEEGPISLDPTHPYFHGNSFYSLSYFPSWLSTKAIKLSSYQLSSILSFILFSSLLFDGLYTMNRAWIPVSICYLFSVLIFRICRLVCLKRRMRKFRSLDNKKGKICYLSIPIYHYLSDILTLSLSLSLFILINE